MASTIKLKRGSGAPTSGSLAAGEPALDLTNNKLYSSTDGTDVVQIGGFNGQFADGTLASPSITFSNDTDTGFSRTTTNTVSFSANGGRRLTLSDSLFATRTTNANGVPVAGSSEQYVEMSSAGLYGFKVENILYALVTDYLDTNITYRAGYFYSGGVLKGAITVGSSGTSYGTISDYRVKENVVPLENAVARIENLNPVRFNFTSDPSHTVDGFLAHEVTPVVPEAITGEKDAVDEEGNPVYQGIDQAKLVPLLVAAVQELSARVAALEAN